MKLSTQFSSCRHFLSCLYSNNLLWVIHHNFWGVHSYTRQQTRITFTVDEFWQNVRFYMHMKWGADFSAFKQIRMIANLITQNSEYQPRENTNCKENMTHYNYLSSFKTSHLILLHKAESMYTYLNVMLVFPVSSQFSIFIMVNWGPPTLPWGIFRNCWTVGIL